MGKFEVYEDKVGAYRWRLKDSEGNVVATGQRGFDTKQETREDVERVQAVVNSTVGAVNSVVDADA